MLRVAAISRLRLQPGQSVLDFGCGTGSSFSLIEDGIGRSGNITGVEISPDMIARARDKARLNGWKNITLIGANAEDVELPQNSFDAVLCFFTHDIMSSRRAVEIAVNALRIGGFFVAAGGKRASGLASILLNPVMLALSLPFITNLSGTKRPWHHLEHFVSPLFVEERFGGSAYIAVGEKTKPKR
jgi:ubiquinone/menaquinone biosynthesis C-methylase UbiE